MSGLIVTGDYNNITYGGRAGITIDEIIQLISSHITNVEYIDEMNKFESISFEKLQNLKDNSGNILDTFSSGNNIDKVTENNTHYFFVAGGNIIALNKLTRIIDWYTNSNIIKSQDAVLNSSFTQTTASLGPSYAPPFNGIKYSPAVSSDGNLLYLTNTDFFIFQGQIFFFVLDAATGTLIHSSNISSNDWSIVGNKVAAPATTAVRTAVKVSNISGEERIVFGTSSGLEYVAPLFGAANPKKSLNTNDINFTRASGAVVCCVYDKTSKTLSREWIKQSCPSHLIGFGGEGSQESLKRTRYGHNIIATGLPSSISADSSWCSILSEDSFIDNRNEIPMLVPMNNGYTMYVNDSTNANHDLEQYLVYKNVVTISGDTDIVDIPFDSFIGSLELFNAVDPENHELIIDNSGSIILDNYVITKSADGIDISGINGSTVLYSNYIPIKIKRIFVRGNFQTTQTISDDLNVSFNLHEIVNDDNLDLDICDNIINNISISSRTLISQYVLKTLHRDLLTISGGYKLDASEAYRLNYAGGSVWGTITIAEDGNVIVPWGNGNNMPLHEMMEFSDLYAGTNYKLSDQSNNYYWYNNIHDLSKEDTLAGYNMIINMNHYVVGYSLIILAYLQKYYKLETDPTIKQELLTYIYILKTHIKNKTENKVEIDNMSSLISKRGAQYLMDCVSSIDIMTGKTLWRSTTPDFADSGWDTRSSLAHQYGKNIVTRHIGSPDYVFTYNYSSKNSRNYNIVPFIPGTDNDHSMEPKETLQYYISPSKSGHILKCTKNDLTYKSNLDISFIKTNILYGSRELGCNFVGDINYGYAMNSTHIITHSRNLSELGVNYMTISGNNIEHDISYGTSIIFVFDISNETEHIIEAYNDNNPHAFHSAVVNVDIPGAPLIGGIGDCDGKVYFVNAETKEVKTIETDAPNGRSSIFFKDNVLYNVGGSSADLAWLVGSGFPGKTSNGIKSYYIKTPPWKN